MRGPSYTPEPDPDEVLTPEAWAGLSEAERMDLTTRITDALTSERPSEVRQIQRMLGVTVDGRVGPETRGAYAHIVGVRILTEPEPELGAQDFGGLTFVLTGTFSVRKSVMKAWIEERDGVVESKVTSRTSYLVVGDTGRHGETAKMTAANGYAIPMIDEKTLRKAL
jgi:NAD-dependent DNA ligase